MRLEVAPGWEAGEPDHGGSQRWGIDERQQHRWLRGVVRQEQGGAEGTHIRAGGKELRERPGAAWREGRQAGAVSKINVGPA